MAGFVPLGGAGGKCEVLIVLSAVNTGNDSAALCYLVHELVIRIIVVEIDIILIIENGISIVMLRESVYYKGSDYNINVFRVIGVKINKRIFQPVSGIPAVVVQISEHSAVLLVVSVKDNVVRALISAHLVAVIRKAGSTLALIVVEVVLEVILIVRALDNRLINAVGDTNISHCVGVDRQQLFCRSQLFKGRKLLGRSVFIGLGRNIIGLVLRGL